MKTLECHSKGDKRFSALYAKVHVEETFDTIENIYQKSKKNYDGSEVKKGERFDYFEFLGKKFPKEFISNLYDLLWLKYFKENKDLLEYACTFDRYVDIFAGKSVNNQADSIRRICKLGYKRVLNSCADFSSLIKSNEPVLVLEKNIFLSKQQIIGHQTNCFGVMGAGVAKIIKNKYPEIMPEYKKYCSYGKEILGTAQMIETRTGLVIANLFGQYTYGTSKKQTINKNLKSALIQMRNYAEKNRLSCCLPFNIGCCLAGGDWNEIYEIIQEVFKDFPVVLYKI